MLTGYPRRGTPTLFSEPDDSSPQPNISDDLDAHPSVLGIRKSPPSREDAERTATMSKRARTEPSGSRNRLCIADFDSLCQSVLKRALSYYRATLNNVSPFPSQLEDRDAATDAWVQACTDLNTKVDFEEPLMKLVSLTLLHSPPLLRLTLPQITSRAAQARGHLKTVAQPLVETLYGLGNGKRATRDRVEDLLENNGFIYKVHGILFDLFSPQKVPRICKHARACIATQLSNPLSTRHGFETRPMKESPARHILKGGGFQSSHLPLC